MDNKTFVKNHPFNLDNMKLKEGLEREVAIQLFQQEFNRMLDKQRSKDIQKKQQNKKKRKRDS